MSRSWPRVASPSPARSTLITSAPNQASSWVQVGPDCTCVKSRMRTPSRALLIACLLGLRFDFCEAGTQLALLGEAGRFVAHDRDDTRDLAILGKQHRNGEGDRQRMPVLVQRGHAQQVGAVLGDARVHGLL